LNIYKIVQISKIYEKKTFNCQTETICYWMKENIIEFEQIMHNKFFEHHLILDNWTDKMSKLINNFFYMWCVKLIINMLFLINNDK
jgi:hypothetical protein